MPLYIFRVWNEKHEIVDEQGADFASEKNACVEAMRSAREIYADRTVNGEDVNGVYFEVVRSSGEIVDKMSLSFFAGPSENELLR